MKKVLLGGALLLISSFSASAMPQTVDLSNVNGARLVISPVVGPAGFTFEFVNSPNLGLTNADQQITGSDPVLTGSANLVDVTGLWRVDQTGIVNCGTGCQIAPIASGNPGQIIFRDGSGTDGIAASLTFTDIRSQVSGGTSGTIQVSAGLNVGQFTNFGAYAGGNVDLDALKTYSGGSYTVSFQSNSAVTLQSLVTRLTPFTSSFSASLTMVPEPSFYSMMLAPAVAGVLFLARRRKQADNV